MSDNCIHSSCYPHLNYLRSLPRRVLPLFVVSHLNGVTYLLKYGSYFKFTVQLSDYDLHKNEKLRHILYFIINVIYLKSNY